jgi:hypothetical protein
MPLSFQAGPRASRLSSSSPSRCQSGPTRQRTACPCSDSVARLRAPWPSRDRSGPAPPPRPPCNARLPQRPDPPPLLPPHCAPFKMAPPLSPPAFPHAPASLSLRPRHQQPPSLLCPLSQDPPRPPRIIRAAPPPERPRPEPTPPPHHRATPGVLPSLR